MLVTRRTGREKTRAARRRFQCRFRWCRCHVTKRKRPSDPSAVSMPRFIHHSGEGKRGTEGIGAPPTCCTGSTDGMLIAADHAFGPRGQHTHVALMTVTHGINHLKRHVFSRGTYSIQYRLHCPPPSRPAPPRPRAVVVVYVCVWRLPCLSPTDDVVPGKGGIRYGSRRRDETASLSARDDSMRAGTSICCGSRTTPLS